MTSINSRASIFRKIISFIKRNCLYVVYRFSFLFKIDDKLVVFESDVDYSDNSWALYSFLLKEYPKYHFAWLLHGNNELQNAKRTIFIHSFRRFNDVKVLSQAKYLFYTHGLGEKFRPKKEQVVVNLWHGIPIKGVKGKTPNQKPIFNYLMCLGEMNVDTIAKFVGCDTSYVRMWGYPRIDLLYQHKEKGVGNPFSPKGFNGKIIMWMPTFRKSNSKHLSEELCDNQTGLPILSEEYQMEEFNAFLNTINVVVLIKPHRLQTSKDVFKKQFSNILFADDRSIKEKGLQLYEIVAKTDALLTDYSSIYIDYLVMDKPIGFAIDDLHEYEKSRGSFLYNPVTDVLCGSHIYSYEDLKNFCVEISQGIDSTKAFRDKIINTMIKYQDGNNCKRIAENLNM